MNRYFFFLLILLHGLLHILGFAKAFDYAELRNLTLPVSKPMGLLWLSAAVLFLVSAVLYLASRDWWWMIALVAVLLSEFVIIMSWRDARFGSIANIIVLLVALAGWGSYSFSKQFSRDVKLMLNSTADDRNHLVTENDIKDLPVAVQNYLRYALVLNKPRLSNMRIVFEGEMREKGKDWFRFTSVQYNFFDQPTRLFYMKAKMFGTEVPGYHRYKNKTASMDIRLFGIIPVNRQSGKEMDYSETVTLFNDMCLMAPASLIDKRISWEAIDSNSVKAVFTNGDISISAKLYFNDQGQLVNFVSNDRYAIAEMKKYPFSTPVHEYKNTGGVNVLYQGDAVWEYPNEKFVYGKFTLKSIEYNVTGFHE
jgi:hypothetical protein